MPTNYFEDLQPRLAQAHYIRTENIRRQTQMELELRGAAVLIGDYEEEDKKISKEILKRCGVEVSTETQDVWMCNPKNLERWGRFGKDGKVEALDSFQSLPPDLIKSMRGFKIDREQAGRLLENWMMDDDVRKEYEVEHPAEFFLLHGMLLDRIDSLFVPYLPSGCNSFIAFLNSESTEFRFHLDDKSPEFHKLNAFCVQHRDRLKVSFGLKDPSPKKLIKTICDLLFLRSEIEPKPVVKENPAFNISKIYPALAKRYGVRASNASEKKLAVYRKVRAIPWDDLDAQEKTYFRAFGDICRIEKRQTAPRQIYLDLYELQRKYSTSSSSEDSFQENSKSQSLGGTGKNTGESHSL